VTHHYVPKGKDLCAYVARATSAVVTVTPTRHFVLPRNAHAVYVLWDAGREELWDVTESQELIRSAQTISFRCFVAQCELAVHRSH
jgi:hypothetical protein